MQKFVLIPHVDPNFERRGSVRCGFGDTISILSNVIVASEGPAHLSICSEDFEASHADLLEGGDRITVEHVDLAETERRLAGPAYTNILNVATNGYARFRKDRMERVTDLPKSFYTVQWDGRRGTFTDWIAKGIHDAIMHQHYKDKIFVDVSAESGYSLGQIAWIMSQAEGHIGLDSGMAHLASTVFDDPERVEMWSDIPRWCIPHLGWTYRQADLEEFERSGQIKLTESPYTLRFIHEARIKELMGKDHPFGGNNRIEPEKTAVQVRKEGNLPPDGRNAMPEFSRLEQVLRQAFAPDMPVYDVNSVQGPDFTEWCYTEGFHCLMAFTQSIEINFRVAREAAAWGGKKKLRDYAKEFSGRVQDKWKLPRGKRSAKGKYVFFPPGNNLDWVMDIPAVPRTFQTDRRWLFKPHPISSDNYVEHVERWLGAERVFPRDMSGMALLKQAATVGFTTTGEMGLFAMVLGKPVVDFSSPQYEMAGRYYSLYRAIRESEEDPQTVINRLLNCPFSGIVPLDTPDREAAKRFKAFKDKSIELREGMRPLVPEIPPLPDRVNE